MNASHRQSCHPRDLCGQIGRLRHELADSEAQLEAMHLGTRLLGHRPEMGARLLIPRARSIGSSRLVGPVSSQVQPTISYSQALQEEQRHSSRILKSVCLSPRSTRECRSGAMVRGPESGRKQPHCASLRLLQLVSCEALKGVAAMVPCCIGDASILTVYDACKRGLRPRSGRRA